MRYFISLIGIGLAAPLFASMSNMAPQQPVRASLPLVSAPTFSNVPAIISQATKNKLAYSYAQNGSFEFNSELNLDDESSPYVQELFERGQLASSQLGPDAKLAQKLYFQTTQSGISLSAADWQEIYQPQASSPEQLVRMSYFALLLDKEEYDLSADEIYENLVAKKVPLDWVYWRYAFKMLQEKEYTKANDALTLGLHLYPQDEDLILLRLSFNQSLDTTGVYRSLDQLPQPYLRIEAYMLKAKLEQQLGRSSLPTLLAALDVHPKSKTLYWALIQSALAEKNYFLAKTKLEQGLTLFPDAPELYSLRAAYYETNGDLPEALASIKKANLLAKNNSAITDAWLRLLLLNQQYDSAALEIERRQNDSNLNPSYFNWLAQYYKFQNRYFSAERVLLKGLSYYSLRGLPLENDDAAMAAMLAEVVEQMHDYPRALRIYQFVYHKNPKDVHLQFALARVFASLKNYSKAEQFYALVKDSQKTSKNKEFNRAFWESYFRFLLDQNNYSVGLKELKSQDPHEKVPYFYAFFAEIYFAKKDYIKALGYVNKALKEYPQDRSLNLLEAAILEKLHDFAGVLAQFEPLGKVEPYSIFWAKGVFVGKYRLSKKLDAKSLARFEDQFGPSLFIEELKAFVNKTYTTRNWAQGGNKLFEQIVWGQENKNWAKVNLGADKPYFAALEDILSAVPSLKDYALPIKPQNQSWRLVYQWQNPKWEGERNLQYIKAAVQKSSHDVAIQGMLASNLINLEKYTEALPYSLAYYKAHPGSRWAKSQLFLIYESISQENKASSLIAELAMLSPDDPNVENSLAWFMLTAQAGKYRNSKKAQELAEKAVKKERNSAFLDTLAEAYYQNNDLDKAIQAIELALVLDPSNSDHFKIQYQKIETAWQNQFHL